MRPMGSSLKFCLVAEGTADFYPRLGPTSRMGHGGRAGGGRGGRRRGNDAGRPAAALQRARHAAEPAFPRLRRRRPATGTGCSEPADVELSWSLLLLLHRRHAASCVLARQPRRPRKRQRRGPSRPAPRPARSLLDGTVAFRSAAGSCAAGGGPLQLRAHLRVRLHARRRYPAAGVRRAVRASAWTPSASDLSLSPFAAPGG